MEIAQEAEGGRENILGVGITVPGVLDHENNILLSAPTLGARNVLLEDLTRYVEFPCSVENDAKSFAYTQMWRDKTYDKKICLLVDRGVGGSLMTGNEVFTNSHNRAGEFGHMIIRPGGKRCACGRKGCLEAYVSTGVLSDELGIHIWDFFSSVSKKPEYKAVLKEYLKNLALGINNISTMYDAPVVIGGEIAKYLEPYMGILIENIKHYDAGFLNEIRVCLSEYGKQESLIGAALMYIEEFLETV
jgi:predicted NBD/HSP70 family sugar kinase